jgi:hypothetical protein
MSGTALTALVIVDEPIMGIADHVAELHDGERAGERLRDALAADGLSLPAGRGLPSLASRIISRLRGRRLLEDLGEVGSAFELLGLHVPPDGRAALELRRSAAASRQVSVTAMGLGFGGGRRLTIAIDEDIPERGACMRVLQHVVLQVRRFATADDAAQPLVMTDVLAWGGREMTAWPDCPHCGVPEDDLNPLEFETDTAHALDLRAFDTAVTRQTDLTLAGSRQADVGLDMPMPSGGKLGVGFRLQQQTSIGCRASYTFPAGGWFVPYRLRDEPATLPYWAVR